MIAEARTPSVASASPPSKPFGRPGTNNRILIVDDEEDVLALVRSNLTAAGYEVLEARDGTEALRFARESSPILIILDIMLPEMNGNEVCRTLKADPKTEPIPIIMLTARAQEIDRVVGLEMGADDYVTKPFSPRELLLRVKSRIRRRTDSGATDEVLRAGDIMVNRSTYAVEVKGKAIDLTPTEFKLLAMLVERSGRVISRDTLLTEIWGYNRAIISRTVDIHVRRLRAKLGRSANLIETVRGFGYRIAMPAARR